MSPVGLILSKLPDARRNGSGWITRCPAHDDRSPSLTIAEGEGGRALLHCHSGCSLDAICDALAIRKGDLFASEPTSARHGGSGDRTLRLNGSGKIHPTRDDAIRAAANVIKGRPVARWRYHRGDGHELFWVVRFERPRGGKDYRPIHRTDAGWKIGDPPGPLPLYRLPELLKAIRQGTTIYIVEGEKCADALWEIDLPATKSAHGSRSPQKTDWSPLTGVKAAILPDNDAPGRKYAEDVAAILCRRQPPATVRVIELPNLPDKGDVVDHIDAKECRDDEDIRRGIEELASATPVWTPAETAIGASYQGRDAELALPWKPLPTDALPEPICRFVVEGAAAMGVDETFLAIPILAVCASAIGTTRRIRLRDEWVEPCVLWTGVVAKSGQVKSPSLDLVLEPIRRMEDDAFDVHTEAMKEHERKVAEYEVDLADWKKHGRKAGDEKPEQPAEPVCERLAVAECTIESLAPLLESNPRGLLLARDELAAWVKSFDQYRSGNGADVANWEELYGARTLTIDRKSGPMRTIRIRNAAVSVTGTIQPRTLARVLKPEFFETGFTSRLSLLAMPPPRKKQWREAKMSPGTKELYAMVIRKLRDLQHTTDAGGRAVPVDLPLTRDGKREWITFYQAFAELQHSTHDDDLRAAYAKIEGAAARLALVFYLIRTVTEDSIHVGPGAVDAVSIRTGVKLAWWFAHEIARIYRAMVRCRQDDATDELIEFIRSRSGEITPSELMHANRRYQPADAARDALHQLVKSGLGVWVHPRPGAAGGRPSTRFRLNTGATETLPEKAGTRGPVTKTPTHGVENGGLGFGGAGGASENADATEGLR